MAFLIIGIALSRSAELSIKIWQFPVPVSITGIVAFSTTVLISPAPPRGISKSTYLLSFINCLAISLSVFSIRFIASSVMPSFFKTSFITFTSAILELMQSLPPLKMMAFPVLKVRANPSTVTLGLDSYIKPITPIGTRF